MRAAALAACIRSSCDSPAMACAPFACRLVRSQPWPLAGQCGCALTIFRHYAAADGSRLCHAVDTPAVAPMPHATASHAACSDCASPSHAACSNCSFPSHATPVCHPPPSNPPPPSQTRSLRRWLTASGACRPADRRQTQRPMGAGLRCRVRFTGTRMERMQLAAAVWCLWWRVRWAAW
jgi:hypothetical protein